MDLRLRGDDSILLVFLEGQMFMKNFQIAASLLAANFACLGDDVNKVIVAGANALHLDAMDNHFVRNLTIGPLICEALRNYGIQAEINVHLMTKPVDSLIIDFAKAKANSIIFHPEASSHVSKSIALIHEQGCKAGIALKPETSLSYLDKIMNDIDTIMVMSVNPGFGGQAFIPSSLEKIKQIRDIIDKSNRDIELMVDGGIKVSNIASVAVAGANHFVVGTGIFHESSYSAALSAMRNELEKS